MQYIGSSEHIFKDQVLKSPESPNLSGNIFSMWYIKRKGKATLASKHKAVNLAFKTEVKIPFFSEIPWKHTSLYCR